MTYRLFTLLALFAVSACLGTVDGAPDDPSVVVHAPDSVSGSGPGCGTGEPPLEDIPASPCDDAADGAFTGCYYAGTSFEELRLVRTDAALSFDWGRGAPDPTVPSDEFSVRWRGRFDFGGGAYVFTTKSDDGVRVSVDGTRILDAWVDEPVTTRSTTFAPGAGSHVIEVEYYENAGEAVASLSWAKQSAPVAGEVKAFPGAEGFGTDTPGGRGGRVIHVTTLADSGPGSFREAVTQSGPRIVVFDVSGTIQLQDGISAWGEDRSYITIAGQTSPGGVQIKGPGYDYGGEPGIYFGGGAHDIVVRFLRVRMGGPNHDNTGCMGVYAPDAAHPSYNIVFDHNSIEWSMDDDAISAGYGYTDNATLSWNLLGDDFLPSMGMWSPYDDSKISAHHNLTVDGGARNPKVAVGIADYRNNVIYNYYNGAAEIGEWYRNRPLSLNLVNNQFIAGPDSYGGHLLWIYNGGPVRPDGQPVNGGGTKIYLAGNWGHGCPSGCNDDWASLTTIAADITMVTDPWPDPLPRATFETFGAAAPFDAPPVTTYPTSELVARVLPTVGAFKPFRDSVDQQMTDHVRNGTGTVCYYHSCGLGGPWPDLAAGAPDALVDSDGDGMPDAWEAAHGLHPDDASDGARISANGYTCVENYLNEMAGDPVPAW